MLGVSIFGGGFNGPAATAPWVEAQEYEFDIWTDDDRTLAEHYGAASPGALFPSRRTVLLDADGMLLATYDPGFSIAGHPQAVLDDCIALFGD